MISRGNPLSSLRKIYLESYYYHQEPIQDLAQFFNILPALKAFELHAIDEHVRVLDATGTREHVSPNINEWKDEEWLNMS